jgi:hypothetical protein
MRKICNLQIVLPLIGEHMVADLAWRHWLGELRTAPPSRQTVILPVALDTTAYNMPAALPD